MLAGETAQWVHELARRLEVLVLAAREDVLLGVLPTQEKDRGIGCVLMKLVRRLHLEVAVDFFSCIGKALQRRSVPVQALKPEDLVVRRLDDALAAFCKIDSRLGRFDLLDGDQLVTCVLNARFSKKGQPRALLLHLFFHGLTLTLPGRVDHRPSSSDYALPLAPLIV